MKSKIGKVFRFALALLIVAQPTLLSAHDFGGGSGGGGGPGGGSAYIGGGGLAGPNGIGNNVGGNIYLWDGSEFFDTTDLILKGVFPIGISRHYNSSSIYDSPMG